MIILIGGVGCTGKTLLANQLMRKMHIPYFPLDHLMMAIYRGMPDCSFTPLDDQFVLGEKMWPVIKGLIMTNVENDHSIILEGFQILPHLLHDFPPDYLDHILSVFVFFSEQYIQDNFDGQITQYRSVIESRSDISDFTPETLIADTNRLKAKCQENDMVFFEIETEYTAGMQVVQDFILTKINN
jgi:putative acetyltransferase